VIFEKRRKALIASQRQNLIPLSNIGTLNFGGGKGAKMSRKNGIVYVEWAEVTSNANDFHHIVYPTAASSVSYTTNYTSSAKADSKNTFTVHPGTYKFIATVDANVDKVYLSCGAVNMGSTIPFQNGANLVGGGVYSKIFTISNETLFGLVFGFRSTTAPYTLCATIKTSLVKIG
jgi:hypothetical protein